MWGLWFNNKRSILSSGITHWLINNLFFFHYFLLKALVNIRVLDRLVNLRSRCSSRLIETCNIACWHLMMRVAQVVFFDRLYPRQSSKIVLIVQTIVIVIFNLGVIVIALINYVLFFIHIILPIFFNLEGSVKRIRHLGLNTWPWKERIFVLDNWVLMTFNLLLLYLVLNRILICIQKGLSTEVFRRNSTLRD